MPSRSSFERSRVISVQPLDSSADVSDLSNLFCFHGAISRASIRGKVGYVEFESASSAISATGFDRTKLAGQTVSVVVVEAALPNDVWEAEEGEEHFECVDHVDAFVPAHTPVSAAAASPVAAASSAVSPPKHGDSVALPAAEVLPPPRGFEKKLPVKRSTPTRATTESPAPTTSSPTKASLASSTSVASATCSKSSRAKPSDLPSSQARGRVLRAFAEDAINSPLALLGMTLAFELLLISASS